MMADAEGAVGGYDVQLCGSASLDDKETDPKTHVQQRGRGRYQNGINLHFSFNS